MGNLVTMRQRGFTLIEMSIVLVIIGLIVGGILKGQELIESARQKNLISQIDQIKSGVTTFVDRFKGYPGDFGRASVVLNSVLLKSGDDNGQVGTNASQTSALATLADATDGENVQFWDHLLYANAIGGGTVVLHSTTITNFSGTGANPSPLPAAAYPQSGLSIMYGTHEGTGTSDSKEGHWLILHRWSGNNTLAGGTTDGVVSPARAYQLDNKYDDGLADGGNIRTLYKGTGCGTAGTTYDATENDVQCHLVFSIE